MFRGRDVPPGTQVDHSLEEKIPPSKVLRSRPAGAWKKPRKWWPPAGRWSIPPAPFPGRKRGAGFVVSGNLPGFPTGGSYRSYPGGHSPAGESGLGAADLHRCRTDLAPSGPGGRAFYRGIAQERRDGGRTGEKPVFAGGYREPGLIALAVVRAEWQVRNCANPQPE